MRCTIRTAMALPNVYDLEGLGEERRQNRRGRDARSLAEQTRAPARKRYRGVLSALADLGLEVTPDESERIADACGLFDPEARAEIAGRKGRTKAGRPRKAQR